MLAALSEWEDIARESGLSKAELSYRWVVYHSVLGPEFGDGVVLGAYKARDLRGTMEGLEKGLLDEWVVGRIDAIWEGVKDEAIMDNFNFERRE